MKTLNILFLGIALTVLFANCTDSDDVEPQNTKKDGVLIAHYPLINDGVDVTGLNNPMHLTNAPFKNDGVYCNGIYSYSSDPEFCVAETPSITSLDLESFSISMEFLVTRTITQPVWVIGNSCRWLGFYLDGNGTVSLLYNNSSKIVSQEKYALNKWQKAQITFDGATVEMSLDDKVACSLKFGSGYVPLENCGETDTEIGVTNYSNGEVLDGYIRNLEVYNFK